MPKSKQNPLKGASRAPRDRVVSAPLARSKSLAVRAPRVQTSQGSTRVMHRELISTITGSVAFANFASLKLNPGLSETFPWLASQATGWEQYRFHKLRFEYISRAPATATGSVLLSPDYDTLDAPPASEQAASTYRDTVESSPWSDFEVSLKPPAMFPMGQRKFIRSGIVAGADYKTYDAGVMHICTTGQANTDGIGKLWVEYDVEFFVPQTASSAAMDSMNVAEFALSSNQSVTTATTSTVVYDTTIMNGIGVTNNSGVFTLPKGNWLVLADHACSGGTSAAQELLLSLEKNSAAFVPPVASGWNGASGTGNFISVSLKQVVQSSGSDTFRLRVTYTSAAGSLVNTQTYCRVVFLLV